MQLYKYATLNVVPPLHFLSVFRTLHVAKAPLALFITTGFINYVISQSITIFHTHDSLFIYIIIAN